MSGIGVRSLSVYKVTGIKPYWDVIEELENLDLEPYISKYRPRNKEQAVKTFKLRVKGIQEINKSINAIKDFIPSTAIILWDYYIILPPFFKTIGYSFKTNGVSLVE